MHCRAICHSRTLAPSHSPSLAPLHLKPMPRPYSTISSYNPRRLQLLTPFEKLEIVSIRIRFFQFDLCTKQRIHVRERHVEYTHHLVVFELTNPPFLTIIVGGQAHMEAMAGYLMFLSSQNVAGGSVTRKCQRDRRDGDVNTNHG